MDNTITYEVVPMSQVSALFSTIQKWRVENYAHFPYLYVSTGAEQEDVSYYQRSSKLVITAAKKDNVIEALAVAIPLSDFQSKNLEFSARNLFETSLGRHIDQYYYISELLFRDPNHSSKSNEDIGKNLLKMVESEIKLDKDFNKIAMLIVERPADHPLRDELFIDEINILKDSGYVKSSVSAKIIWNTRLDNHKNEQQENKMILWSRAID